MFGPISGFQKLNDKIKLINFSPNERERTILLSMWDELSMYFPEKSSVSISFTNMGEYFQAEALVGFLGLCVLSKQTDSNLEVLSDKLKHDVISKLNTNSNIKNWTNQIRPKAV